MWWTISVLVIGFLLGYFSKRVEAIDLQGSQIIGSGSVFINSILFKNPEQSSTIFDENERGPNASYFEYSAVAVDEQSIYEWV